jgi:S1-C subfamily serine protease
VTTGTVSSLSGLGNDTAKLQIAAPVQLGNSGGPLLDRHGLVVGVVQSKLNALRIAGVTGDIPQNVNFAVNGATLQSFLDANAVAYRAQPAAGAPLAAADVGEQAARYTVAIECAR